MKIENALNDFFLGLGLHEADQLHVTTAAVQAFSETLPHAWHMMVQNHRFPAEAGPLRVTFSPISRAAKLHQDKEKVVDRLKFLEQKAKEGKKLKRLATLEQKRAERVLKARKHGDK